MKIYFHKGENWRSVPQPIKGIDNLLSLSYNNWDDYGIATTLNAVLYFEGAPVLDFSLKILVKDDKNSPKKLNELREKGWDGYFPIPNLDYVSVPSDIDFYSILLAKTDKKDAIDVLTSIKDAGYLTQIVKDENAIALANSYDFKTSPLREGGARKAFSDGWLLFEDRKSTINDFTLNILCKNGIAEPINFHFNSQLLPYDINVLIGPNGIGKSHALKSLVEYWLGVDSGSKIQLEQVKHIPFDTYPNISKLILISYSPFEEFTIDLSKSDLNDKDAYKYFGFRRITINDEGVERVGISRNLPASDSVKSIYKSLIDDDKYKYIQSRTIKFDTILQVLKNAIEFDDIAVEIITGSIFDDLISSIFPTKDILQQGNIKYLKLNNKTPEIFIEWMFDYEKSINLQSGVIFVKDEKIVDISSGQRLFSYIVINVVGQIKENSLIVIDEPELFLHPTLEIQFITLLKQVLISFNSKAILATHSLAISREIPSRCIHVFQKYKNSIDVSHPPFETFGGDMQRISSYVFGDSSLSKPFDLWIENKINEFGDKKSLIQALGSEINEELLIKILNTGNNDGN